MKFYDIDSVFTFGKYEGMTIAEVYEKDPKYLKYCEENIDEFYAPALCSSPHLLQGDCPRPWQESDGHHAGQLAK